MLRRKFDLIRVSKPWPLALLAPALALSACTTPAPKPEAIIVPPAPQASVENTTPTIKPRDTELPDGAPTTPVESSTLPPVRKR